MKGLSSNQLKILALIAMTCDHVGKQLLPQYEILPIIGRLAFPIFAYMIAEGCRYTRNRKKYFLTMFALAFVCQVVYFVAMGSLYQCVLVTFTLAIGLIYAVDYAMKQGTVKGWSLAGMAFLGAYFICKVLPDILMHTDFEIDYGIWGVLLSVFVYLANNKTQKIALATATLILLSFSMGGNQWYCLFTIPLLSLYNGKRGQANLKNLFYIYYPAHLVGIYLIDLL